MQYRIMTIVDIPLAAAMYRTYYNTYEDGKWTLETAENRIRQVLTRMDSYSLLCEDAGEIVAMAMGYFEQYDDGSAYDLVEIVVAADFQNRGVGTEMMYELEWRVREKGAMLIQLQAVNDAHHAHFYTKLGYGDAKNLVMKTKMLV